MMANFIPYKGHREAVEALDRVRRDFPAVELWLWGRDGASAPGVKKLCRDLGLDDRIRFLGLAHDPADALRQLDIFLSASHEEGFSNSILEAMATGLPVVATSVGGTAEQIEHGETGLLVSPGDSQALSEALRKLLSDETLARRLGSAARFRAVDHFSVERMVHEMARLYEEIAAKP
jgi:glycosyltransferase involved in cell wall biosynthesis